MTDFKPNLTPRQIFKLGSFGGTYWRPIYSSITKKNYKDQHKKFPKSWWKDIPTENLTSETCNPKINKYKVNVGTSLKFWEDKGWIIEQDPYGWIEWYCHYTQGRRTSDDQRQIDRWQKLAGEKGRFRLWLITQIQKSGKSYDEPTVSPKIRQTLQHWGYKLTKSDYDKEVKRRQYVKNDAKIKL